MVLEQIIRDLEKEGRSSTTMHKTCIYRNKKNAFGGWGFCDLYDYDTGEVWELKRVTCSKENAKAQLKGYLNGALKHYPDLPLVQGGRIIPDGEIRSFTHKDSTGTYYITYWDSGDGILMYDYVYKKSTAQTIMDATAVAGLVICTTVLCVSAVATYGATAPAAVAAAAATAQILSNAA